VIQNHFFFFIFSPRWIIPIKIRNDNRAEWRTVLLSHTYLRS